MGWFTWFWNILIYLGLAKKTVKLSFLGLDNSGKTLLLRSLAIDLLRHPSPTFQPITQEFTLGNLNVKVIDFGGNSGVRWQLKDFFTEIDGVVFFVDAATPERFEEAKTELDILLQTEELLKTPFVILGNKIDLPKAVPEDYLKAQLGLAGLTTGKGKPTKGRAVRALEVFMCSVVKKSWLR